jgi:fumarylacetoacetate (FAA) hydrolase
MKLATLKDGSRDGLLLVVSRDLKTAHVADGIAPTLQRALDDWAFFAPQLEELATQLNQGRAKRPFELDPTRLMAPLPRAYQWLDASAYQAHLERMREATGVDWVALSAREPLVYQGGSDDFLGPTDDAPFVDEAHGIDFEAEIAAVLGDVPMQVKREDALDHVRLLMLVNDWSLRNLGPGDLKKQFGFFLSKPATAFAPVAVTPDELGGTWREGLLASRVRVEWNGVRFGELDSATQVRFGFAELIAFAAKTRNLRAGTITGMGTISSSDPNHGYATIAEARAQEKIAQGEAKTAFMKFGDRVRIEAFDAHDRSVFGAIEQQAVSYKKRRAQAADEGTQDGAQNAVQSSEPHHGPSDRAEAQSVNQESTQSGEHGGTQDTGQGANSGHTA